MEIRIFLKAKENNSFNYKVGEGLILYNNVFDLNTGIAYFPIDKKNWKVERFDRFSEFKDINGTKVFENDLIVAQLFPEDGNSTIYGKVVFDSGCFCIEILEIRKNISKCGYDVGSKPILLRLKSIQITE